MFGQKPGFGASQTPSFSSFGQSAFSKTPQAQSFNNTAFAPQNSSVFGPQTLTSTGLFGSTTPNNPQQAAFGCEKQFFLNLHFNNPIF